MNPHLWAMSKAGIRLIWDFRGKDAEGMAIHHAKHLSEFARREKMTLDMTGVESVDTMHSYAYMDIEEQDMIPVRDALRPHRGLKIELDV